jgi:hypothetical protein
MIAERIGPATPRAFGLTVACVRLPGLVAVRVEAMGFSVFPGRRRGHAGDGQRADRRGRVGPSGVVVRVLWSSFRLGPGICADREFPDRCPRRPVGPLQLGLEIAEASATSPRPLLGQEKR